MALTLSRIRVPLGFVAAAVVLYLATPTPQSTVVGIPLGLLGLAWRAAAAGVIQKDHELALNGPYRFTRNPLYFGSFLLTLSVAVMSASPWSALVVLVPFVLIYPRVIGREETHLEKLFGDRYAAFKQDTPTFFPRRMGPAMFESFSLVQYRVNGEYNAALGFLGVLGILLLKLQVS